MKPLRFVHAAQLRLDLPFTGVGHIPPRIATALSNASVEAWDNLVDFTIQKKALFLLIAGGIYDNLDRGVRCRTRFLRGLKKLTENDVQIFIALGPEDSGSALGSIRWHPGVTVMETGDVRTHEVLKNGEVVALVSGLNLDSTVPSEAMLERFRKGDRSQFRIGLLPSPFAAPLTPELVASLPIHYWALGGSSTNQIHRSEAPWVVSPGLLQARSVESGVAQPHGAYVVEIEKDKVSSVEFQALDAVRVVEMHVPVNDVEKMSQLASLLNRSFEDIRKKSGDTNFVVKAVLTGTSKLHFELRSESAVASTLAALRHGGGDTTPFVWWSAIEDRTDSPVPSVSILRRQDFSAQILWTSKQLLKEPSRLHGLLQDQTKPLENPAIGRWLTDLTEPERAELMKEAVALSLGMLES